jgi:hypothetical protein
MLEVQPFQCLDFLNRARYFRSDNRFLRSLGVNMTGLSSKSVSQLLVKWKGGDQEALRDLVPLVYKELRRLARHYLQGENPGHTLESAALAHVCHENGVARR